MDAPGGHNHYRLQERRAGLAVDGRRADAEGAEGPATVSIIKSVKPALALIALQPRACAAEHRNGRPPKVLELARRVRGMVPETGVPGVEFAGALGHADILAS